MDPSNQLITIAQAADEFGINPKTLETWHHRGEITRIGTAPKIALAHGRRAGLYDRAQIKAAIAARAANEQRRFDAAVATAVNGTSSPSSAQPAELFGIRQNSGVLPTNKVVHAALGGGRLETRSPGQHETTRVETREAHGPAASETGRGSRAPSIRFQLAHQLTAQRCALPGCGLPLNALTVHERDEFCSLKCARAHYKARRESTESA